MTKKELRLKIKNRLAGCGLDFKAESAKICKAILESEAYRKSEIILAYMAMDDEVDLSEVIQAAVKDGKQVYLPRIIPHSSDMDFYQYDADGLAREGIYGILEPAAVAPMLEVKKYKADILLLTPGRAFTLQGDRLGRGKGYYDCYIRRLKKENDRNVTLAGVCFPVQILPEITTEEHDVKMDLIFRSTINEKKQS